MEASEQIAISVRQAAKLLGVSAPTAYRMVHIENFPSFKINGRVMVYRQGLEEWVKQLSDNHAKIEFQE